MYKCIFCNRLMKNASGLATHSPYCKENPNRKQRMTSPLSGRKKGKPAWNKGKTKETDPSLARPSLVGVKFGLSVTGHTAESRKKISDSMKGNQNANHRGDRQSYHNGLRMDSRWEVGTARYFDSKQIDWKYNERGYVLSDGRYYYPDFFIYEKGSFVKLVEVKGYFRESNRKKFDMFLAEYPEIQIELWQRSKLFELGIIDCSGYIKV